MKRRIGFAAGGMMLALAAPAAGQGLSAAGDYETVVEVREVRSKPAKRHRAPDLPQRFPEEGITPSGDRVIGTLPVLPGADLNVGLFSVQHLSHKELARRRTERVREVRGPKSRVAAFAFSMRF